MSKVIAASMVLVLAISTGLLADGVVGQVQQQMTNLGVTNDLELMHGEQCASSLQNLVVNNEQCSTGICAAHVGEVFFAAIGQSADATGQCALVGAVQALTLTGTQGQQVAQGVGPKGQLQGVGLLAAQTLAKSDGAGGTNALHTIVANADQTAENPAGVEHETSTIMGMQTSSLNGAPGATGLVDAHMAVTTTQTQTSI